MKRKLFAAALFVIFFAGAVLVFNVILNRNLTYQSVENTKPTMDLAYAGFDGVVIDEMQGQRQVLNTSLTRDSIVTVDKSQEIEVFLPGKYADKKVSYMLRNFDGSNLVEDGEMTFKDMENGMAVFTVAFRMSLTQDTEYRFFISMDEIKDASATDAKGETIYYSTRVKKMEKNQVQAFLSYAELFHANMLAADQNAAVEAANAAGESNVSVVEIATGMDAVIQTGSGKDNSIYHVTLASSVDALTYAGMQLEIAKAPVASITELAGDHATIKYSFKAICNENDGVHTYSIDEYFQLKYEESKAAVTMTAYTRDMEEDFRLTNIDSNNRSILLGVTDPDQVNWIENEKGYAVAFVVDDSVWFYNSRSEYISSVFGSNAVEAANATHSFTGSGIRLLKLDEETLTFAVFGRVQEGEREGQNGIALYQYQIDTGVLQEVVFIETDLEYEALKLQVGRLMYYVSERHMFYTLLGDSLLEVNVRTGAKKELVKDMPADLIYVSEDMTAVAFPDTSDLTAVKKIHLLNLETNKEYVIEDAGRNLNILSFLGDNLLYGSADAERVSKRADGTPNFYYSAFTIVNRDNSQVKKYEKSGFYISDYSLEQGKVYLTRVTTDPSLDIATASDANVIGGYMEASSDYMSYLPEDKATAVTVTSETDEDGIERTYLKFPNTVYISGSPDEILTKVQQNRAERVLNIESTVSKDDVYLYDVRGVQGLYRSKGSAIKLAEENHGFITDGDGNKIYEEKTVKPFLTVAGTFAYQKADTVDASYDACTYMALLSTGSAADYSSVQKLHNFEEAFQEYGSNALGLNVSGADLDTAIVFLSDGAPFVARISSGYVLVVSYNSEYIRYYNPLTDSEERMVRSAFERECIGAGNEFYVWQKK